MKNVYPGKRLSYLEKEMIRAPYCSDNMKTLNRTTSAIAPYFMQFEDVAEQLNGIIPLDKHCGLLGQIDFFYSPFGKFCFIAEPNTIDPSAFPACLDLKVRRIILTRNSISGAKYYLDSFVPKDISTNDRYFTIQSKIHAISVFSMMIFFMTHFDMSKYTFKVAFPDESSFWYYNEHGTLKLANFCSNVYLESATQELFDTFEAAFSQDRPIYISLQAYYKPREEQFLKDFLDKSNHIAPLRFFTEVGYSIFSIFY